MSEMRGQRYQLPPADQMQDMPPPDFEEATEIMISVEKTRAREEPTKRPNMKMGEQLDPFSKAGDPLYTIRESVVVPLPV